ncbi:Tubulin polyglutamylase TTLL5 [Armadillidium vulgare]|nr:Tubulin polyglutamylase TTLL5 [Armadillidium vulgare]
MKTSSDFSKDRSRDRKYSKLKHNHDRSLSYERNPQLKAKAGQLILTQNGVNKHTSYESSTNVNNREHLHHRSQTMSRSRSECPHKLAQMVSRSPKRNFNKENNEEFGKDQKDKTGRKQDQAAAERQMKNRFPTRTQNIDSLPPNGKTSKQEQHYWKFEKDVMWTYNANGGKRGGYLLFKCSYLDQEMKDSLARKYEMTFKFSQADSKLIRMLLEAHGFREVNSASSYFNLYWGNAHFSPNEIRQLQEWQKINHFPRSSELTRKDRLYMNIKRMQRQFGVKLFDFIPTSFVLPTEYREFCDTHLRERGTWIVDQVPPDETSLICRYLESPLLVDGYKCDLRLYVAVTSLDPLVVYLYEEGLVRLATIKYQHGKNLWNPCIHLTNYSVNKFHSNYVQNEDPEVDDRGNKWSLSAFLRHLKSRGIDTGALMRGIEDVIIKSILSASYQMNTATNMFVPHSRNCFELYGFDILIDSHLKPWVLEVNLSPSLNMDQPLDLKIKSAMLADLFSLVGIQVCNPNTARTTSRPVYRKLPNLRYSTESIERSQYGGRFGTSGTGSGGSLTPNADELRVFRQLREEYERKGGWARIFPTPDSWAMYGSLQEFDSPLNLILHLHLYPNVPRNSRYYRVAPLKMSSVSSSGLASSLERLNCYERALPKGFSFLKSKFTWSKHKEKKRKVIKDIDEVKASLVNALENGLDFKRRLMIGCDQEKQTDLVYRFLRSATRTLHLPFNVQAPSKTLPHEARAVVISKQLGDFIQAYTKETHLYVDQAVSTSCSSLSSQCPPSAAPTPSDPSARTPIHGSTNSLDLKENDPQSYHLSFSKTKDKNSDCLSYSPTLTSVSLLSVAALPLNKTSSGNLSSVTGTSPSSVSRQTSASSVGSSLNPPSSSTPSIHKASPAPSASSSSSTSFSTSQVGGTASRRSSGLFQSRLRRFKSEPDSGICSNAQSDDEGGNFSQAPSEVNNSDLLPPSLPTDGGSRKSSEQEDGIAMELYRMFLSNAGESDLEEVLSLQTRIHNSAGVFLDPARRGRSSGAGTPSGSNPVSIASSRPRTPTASPQGSPRRARRSPVHGERGTQNQQEEPVTSEPHSSNMKRSQSGSGLSLSAAGGGGQAAVSSSTTSSCCLFGNILKASLKGTKVSFNT